MDREVKRARQKVDLREGAKRFWAATSEAAKLARQSRPQQAVQVAPRAQERQSSRQGTTMVLGFGG